MLVRPVRAVLMLPQDHQVPKDPRDRLAKPDHQARQEILEPRPSTNHCDLESLESPETPDLRDRPDHQEMPAKTARLARRDRRDPRDRRDHLAPTASPAQSDPPAHPETRARKASVRNTVRWTAAFSSRMVQGDKRSGSGSLYSLMIVCAQVVTAAMYYSALFDDDSDLPSHQCNRPETRPADEPSSCTSYTRMIVVIHGGLL